MKAAATAPKGHQRHDMHGLYSMKKALMLLGKRAIDGRTQTGKALAQWKADLIADLGGSGNVSTQQSAIVDLAVKSKLLLDSIDSWLLVQPSLVNARKRALIPVVLQRQTLADGLARYLTQLGLERRHKVQTLHEILSQQDTDEEELAKPANGNGQDTPESA